jgi:Tfp pilus assembly protein PilN
MSGTQHLAAMRYQINDLHLFPESQEISWATVPVGRTCKSVRPTRFLVFVVERHRIVRYADLFKEAGIRVSAFTVIESSIHAATHARRQAVPLPFVVIDIDTDSFRVYGQSAAQPAWSAELSRRSVDLPRAISLAESNLRIPEDETSIRLLVGDSHDYAIEANDVGLVIGPVSAPPDFTAQENFIAFGAALESLRPSLGLGANLLPREYRRPSSRLRYLLTGSSTLLLCVVHLTVGWLPSIHDKAYARRLQDWIVQANIDTDHVSAIEAEAENLRKRLGRLVFLSGRTVADLTVLKDVSERLPTDAWLVSMQVNDQSVRLVGFADAAAPLLKTLNESPTLTGAAFSSSLQAVGDKERFEIVADRTWTRAAWAASASSPLASNSDGSGE